MEPDDVDAPSSCTSTYRLDPIEEDDSEEPQMGPQNPPTTEDNNQGQSEPTKSEGPSSALTSRSIVASMKKVISSLGPNATSSSANFVHINDCFKDKSDKQPDQADAFVPDLSIHLVMVRGGIPDAQLQGDLRNRLRLLENDSKEVAGVLCELSARLLSIESDKDLITVTFRTFEEIWKFSTYFSLGFLNHCMENVFLDESFWLTSLEGEDAGIQVLVNEESLNRIYKGLLMEEGMYFVLCADSCVRQAAIVDGTVQIFHSRPSAEWIHTDPSMADKNVLGSNASAEALCPFHQWFLKKSISSDLMDFAESHLGSRIAVGWSEAVVNYESNTPDEMTYQSGDMIETVSTYIECLEWFVGRNATTSSVGFVKTSNMKPYTSDRGNDSASYLVDEDQMSTKSTENFDMEAAKALLHKISHSEVCHLYKLDQFEGIKVCQDRETLCATLSTDTDGLKEKLETLLTKPNICSPSPDAFNGLQANSVDSSEVQTICDEHEDLSFCICEEEEKHESLQSLLLFLNNEKYLLGFRKLYDISYTFLQTTFHGYNEEEELVRYLSVAREAAKKSSMTWAQARICFLLGRLCTRKHKFSQARVYFEEAMGVINGDFSDIFLFAAVHVNLYAIYLKQKSKEKCLQMIDKSSSLILGLQKYINSTDVEPVILKYALKKAILSQDQSSEIKASRLLAKTYINLRQFNEALPFIERIQVLNNKTDSNKGSLSRFYLQLADIYSYKCLPYLTLSCVKVASQTSCSFMDSLRSVGFIIENTSKLCGIKKPGQIFPPQVAYHLRRALTSVVTDQEQELCTSIYLSLAELCISHKLHKEAHSYIMKAVDTSVAIDMKYRVDMLVSLAWLYMLDRQNTVALDILNTVLSFCCTQHQLGIAHNLIGIALRREENIKYAGEHYCKALQISKDTGSLPNQGAVLANFGTLCLHLSARILAEQFLAKSVTIYSKLPILDNNTDFINVLLMLGYHYITGDNKENGRFYYEWALLVAMATNNLEGQLHAIQRLCHFYNTLVINEAQCIIYNEYQLSLARKMSDKVLEGQVLETISQLFLSLGTERACRSALEYTKGSLGIFIDLQAKEKEAYAWLMAGKIYYILEQNELVDLYIQVAQNVALCTGDPQLGMELYEASGDIFFNGSNDRNKATTFYRDCALPLAVKTGNVKAELRLSNKLTELLTSMKNYEESLEHAKMALALSVNLGDQLNERVAYHRLAGIYSHLNQCELAEHYYLKALSLCTSPLELEEETVYYMKVYLVLGDIIFYDLKDPYDAAGYYHLALAAAMDLGNKKSQLKIYTRLAVIYHNFLIDREKSLYFYQKARTFAAELNVRRINLSPEQRYQSLTRTYTY
ncbi:SH3 domain and tetratricopeptide repeat-containing protein 1 [Mixophyes fleayi]|uniref:SH3 domain and tetratricopeptide repeat-containing protein 1 n=1 Tax=Mixophyes fleayi TaxID=3061075 RepID=UPI003F4E2B7D